MSEPEPPVVLPGFKLEEGDDVELLLAISDIDDDFSTKSRRTQRAYIIAASQKGFAWVWDVVSRWDSTDGERPEDTVPDISLLSHYQLPIDSIDGKDARPHLILPVDPMGWHQSPVDWQNMTSLQDMVLTVSSGGMLEFWTPRLSDHVATSKDFNKNAHLHDLLPWSRSGSVKTDRENTIMARCSSRKKTALGECEIIVVHLLLTVSFCSPR
jgi:hypothetical protein